MVSSIKCLVEVEREGRERESKEKEKRKRKKEREGVPVIGRDHWKERKEKTRKVVLR